MTEATPTRNSGQIHNQPRASGQLLKRIQALRASTLLIKSIALLVVVTAALASCELFQDDRHDKQKEMILYRLLNEQKLTTEQRFCAPGNSYESAISNAKVINTNTEESITASQGEICAFKITGYGTYSIEANPEAATSVNLYVSREGQIPQALDDNEFFSLLPQAGKNQTILEVPFANYRYVTVELLMPLSSCDLACTFTVRTYR